MGSMLFDEFFYVVLWKRTALVETRGKLRGDGCKSGIEKPTDFQGASIKAQVGSGLQFLSFSSF